MPPKNNSEEKKKEDNISDISEPSAFQSDISSVQPRYNPGQAFQAQSGAFGTPRRTSSPSLRSGRFAAALNQSRHAIQPAQLGGRQRQFDFDGNSLEAAVFSATQPSQQPQQSHPFHPFQFTGAIPTGRSTYNSTRSVVGRGAGVTSKQLTNIMNNMSIQPKAQPAETQARGPAPAERNMPKMEDDDIDPINNEDDSEEAIAKTRLKIVQEFLRVSDKLKGELLAISGFVTEDEDYNPEQARLIQDMHDNIRVYMTRLASIAGVVHDRYNDPSYKKSFKALQQAYNNEKKKILKYLAGKPNPPGLNVTPQPHLPARMAKAPPRPERLSIEANPYEFHDWEARLLAYSRFHDFIQLRYEDQKEQLKTCLGPELSDLVSSDPRQLPMHSDEFDQRPDGVDFTWLEVLQQYFLRRYPLSYRRIDIVTAEPRIDEPDSDYIRRVVRDCGVAQYDEKLSATDALISCFAGRVRNPALRAILTDAQGANLMEVVTVADDIDNNFQGTYTYLPQQPYKQGYGKNAPRQASQHQSWQQNKPKPNNPPQVPQNKPQQGKSNNFKRCTFCSKFGHKEPQCETKKKTMKNLAIQAANQKPPEFDQSPSEDMSDNTPTQSVAAMKATGATGSVPHNMA